MSFQAGSITTKIGGDIAPLGGAFSKAKAMAQGFSASMSRSLATIGRGITAPLNAFAASTAAVLSVGAITAGIAKSMQAIDASAKAADRLGIATEAYVALGHQANLAGVEQEALSDSLTRLQSGLVDAAKETGPVADAFARLGLSGRELVNLPLEQAFGRIGDALNGVGNANQRAALAADIFGQRGGPKLLGMLSQGTEGIKAARAEAEKLGITFSRFDAAKVENANDTFGKVRRTLGGVGAQLAISVAPYVEGISNKLVELATNGDSVGKKVLRATEWVSKGFANTTDNASLLLGAYNKLAAAVGYWIAVGVTGVSKLAQATSWLLDKIGQGFDTTWIDSLAKGFDDQQQHLRKLGDAQLQAWRDRVNSKAVTRAFADFRAQSDAAANNAVNNGKKLGDAYAEAALRTQKAMEKVGDSLERARQDVADFGLSDTQKRLAEFSRMEGVDAGQIKEFKSLMQSLEKGKQWKKMEESAKRFGDWIKTPMDEFEDRLKEVQTLFDKGLINHEDARRGVMKAGEEFSASAQEKTLADNPKLAPLIRAGSAEAMQMQFNLRNKGRQDNDKVPQKHLDVAQRQEQILQQIERKLDFGFMEI